MFPWDQGIELYFLCVCSNRGVHGVLKQTATAEASHCVLSLQEVSGLLTAHCVFLVLQEVPGGPLLHHHRAEQPSVAAGGPQLGGGRLRDHQHQPSGQLLPLWPLPAQEVLAS